MLGFSLCVCVCVFLCVDAETLCVCVWTLKMPSQAPLLWGGNGAINSRVSPGGGPATEALARKWLISVERKGKGGGDKRIFVSLIISEPRQTTLAGQRGGEEEEEEVGGGAASLIRPQLPVFWSFQELPYSLRAREHAGKVCFLTPERWKLTLQTWGAEYKPENKISASGKCPCFS